MFLAGALAAGGCAAAYSVPSARTLVIHSGARIQADQGRLAVIDIWVRRQQENIVLDPSFLVMERRSTNETYPWDGMTMSGDTVEVLVYGAAPESGSFLSIYGHFHMMSKMGRLDEFLPEAVSDQGVGAEGYELERAILARVSDAWLYGRAAFDSPPFGPLDELLFSNENGYLDAFIFTARPDEFATERNAWLEENPGRDEEYRRWFLETFEAEPTTRKAPEAD
jgi:hypothetical protein